MVTLAVKESTEQARLHSVTWNPVHSAMAQDEHDVDFDRFMIVHSDHVDPGEADLHRIASITSLMLGHDACSLESETGSVGATVIGCYQGDRFVGSISFYSDPHRHPQSDLDAEGRIHLWFPVACLANVLSLLRHEKCLSLCLVYADLDGRVLTHPLGALLTWPEPTGKEVQFD